MVEIPNMLKILLVEDSDTFVYWVQTRLKKEDGFQIDVANTLAEATEHLKNDHYSVIILDLGIKKNGGKDYSYGVNTLLSIKERTNTSIVVLTAEEDESVRTDCMTNGACAYFAKRHVMENQRQFWESLFICSMENRPANYMEEIKKAAIAKAHLLSPPKYQKLELASLGGLIVVVVIILLDAACQYVTTNTYKPPDWIAGILLPALGLGGVSALRQKDNGRK